jgi:hypothetical protein
MFVERKVHYSDLFTNLVGWHAGAVSFPLSNVILALLAYPLSDVMFCLHSRITNLSLYKHWVYWLHRSVNLVVLGQGNCTIWYMPYFYWKKCNGSACFIKSKQLLEYQHFLLLRAIWWSKLYSIFKLCSIFQHQC